MRHGCEATILHLGVSMEVFGVDQIPERLEVYGMEESDSGNRMFVGEDKQVNGIRKSR